MKIINHTSIVCGDRLALNWWFYLVLYLIVVRVIHDCLVAQCIYRRLLGCVITCRLGCMFVNVVERKTSLMQWIGTVLAIFYPYRVNDESRAIPDQLSYLLLNTTPS